MAGKQAQRPSASRPQAALLLSGGRRSASRAAPGRRASPPPGSRRESGVLRLHRPRFSAIASPSIMRLFYARAAALLAIGVVLASFPSSAEERLLAVLEFKSKLDGAEAKTVDVGYLADVVRSAALEDQPGLRVMTRENMLVLVRLRQGARRLRGRVRGGHRAQLGADLVVSGEMLRSSAPSTSSICGCTTPRRGGSSPARRLAARRSTSSTTPSAPRSRSCSSRCTRLPPRRPRRRPPRSRPRLLLPPPRRPPPPTRTPRPTPPSRTARGARRSAGWSPS